MCSSDLDYLAALRDVERRIQKAEEQSSKELPDVSQPAGIPDSFEAHVRLLYDLQLLAYQSDLTRVISFMVDHEQSPRPYPEIGIPDGHHPLSHHNGDGEKIEKGAVLAQWDPYNVPVLSEKGGTLHFKDMIPGVTVKRELDESSGRIATVVIDHKEDLNPQIEIRDAKNKPLAAYSIPVGAQIAVIDELRTLVMLEAERFEEVHVDDGSAGRDDGVNHAAPDHQIGRAHV